MINPINCFLSILSFILFLNTYKNKQVINNTHDNLIIKRIKDIINKMNLIINDNKKNTELIIGRISLLKNQMNSKLDKKKYVDDLYASKSRKQNYVKQSYLANLIVFLARCSVAALQLKISYFFATK